MNRGRRYVPIAGTPVSFGVWGPHGGPADGDAAGVLHELSLAGYHGTEFGPIGYLGDPARTADLFAVADLRPAGAAVEIPLIERRLSAATREELLRACRTLRAVKDTRPVVGPPGSYPPAPIVLTDAGAPAGPDHDAWPAAVAALREAALVVADHGLRSSFGPRLATLVESAADVDRLLQTTDLTLTLDTGHALLAGTDPVRAVREWGSRISHVHVKDVVAGAPGAAGVRLGTGDVDLPGVLQALQNASYAGWYVVEQDVVPDGGPQLTAFGAAQRENLDTLLGLLDLTERR